MIGKVLNAVSLAFVFSALLAGPPPVVAQPQGHLKGFDLSPLRQGEFLLQSKQPEQALKVFKDLWENEPDHSYAVRGMVRAYQMLGQYPQAIAFFQDHLKSKPKSSPAAYALGYIDYLQGRYDAARGRLQEALEYDPDNALALNALAAALTELKDYRGALEQVRKAIDQVPAELMFYRNLKMIYSRSGMPQRFEEEYRQYLREGRPAKAFNYGMILAQQERQASFKYYVDGKMDETLTAIQRMLALYREIDHKPGIVAGLFSLAVLYEEQGKLDEALKAYEKVIKINPQHIQAQEKIRVLSPKKD